MKYSSALALLSLASVAAAQTTSTLPTLGPPIPSHATISDPLSILSTVPGGSAVSSIIGSLTSGIVPPPISPSSTAPTTSATAPTTSNTASTSGSGTGTSSAPSATKSGSATVLAAKGLGVTFATGLLAAVLL
ncbi:hypothetical protein B0H11DRAFT_2054471 [Mycena galericulata]|nr:hypothetical protein B0H11DRAFT_2054471 [Mycena galericulata]